MLNDAYNLSYYEEPETPYGNLTKLRGMLTRKKVETDLQAADAHVEELRAKRERETALMEKLSALETELATPPPAPPPRGMTKGQLFAAAFAGLLNPSNLGGNLNALNEQGEARRAEQYGVAQQQYGARQQATGLRYRRTSGDIDDVRSDIRQTENLIQREKENADQREYERVRDELQQIATDRRFARQEALETARDARDVANKLAQAKRDDQKDAIELATEAGKTKSLAHFLALKDVLLKNYAEYLPSADAPMWKQMEAEAIRRETIEQAETQRKTALDEELLEGRQLMNQNRLSGGIGGSRPSGGSGGGSGSSKPRLSVVDARAERTLRGRIAQAGKKYQSTGKGKDDYDALVARYQAEYGKNPSSAIKPAKKVPPARSKEGIVGWINDRILPVNPGDFNVTPEGKPRGLTKEQIAKERKAAFDAMKQPGADKAGIRKRFHERTGLKL